MRSFNREELKAKMDRGEPLTLVEALSENRFREGHLPQAINLPTDRVRDLAPRRLPDRDAEIVVYCSHFT